MMLSLIKSKEWLNRNFSNKSQNRIGFKFGFYTHLSVLIITFYCFCKNLVLNSSVLREGVSAEIVIFASFLKVICVIWSTIEV
jgi:hypothetical protein